MLESAVMEVPWHLIGFAFALVNLVVAQDGSGFISIDCGIPRGSSYTDATTGISYTSDVSFIDSGVSSTIQTVYNTNSLDRRLLNLRSFPQGTRNCYMLRPSQGKGYRYLIRATFLYGNYDFKNQPPNFDLYIGVNLWGNMVLDDSSTPGMAELLHVLSSDYLEFCLVNTNQGTPFISSLEVRPLNSSLYGTQSGSLQLASRVNFGPTTSTQIIRYKDDIYDRIWTPMTMTGMTMLATSSRIGYGMFQVPSIVMSTAMVPQNTSQELQVTWTPRNISNQFYVYFHFAEVESLQANQSRKFNIYINGKLKNPDAALPIVPSYLSTLSLYTSTPLPLSPNYTVEINKTADSTLPPIINAFEVYLVRQLNNLQTDDGDAAAMWSIKEIYGVVKRNWQGDPCGPAAFKWDGVDCSSDGSSLPRITTLNLSGSGLTGELASAISNLTAIQTLDLSYNNLSGQIPESLAQLSSLSVLNLKGNNFTGPIPALLLQKRDKGLLSLSIDNSTTLVLPPDTPKKKSIVIPVVASVIPASFVLLALSAYMWVTRRKNRQDTDHTVSRHREIEIPLETKNLQLTFSDIERITNNFQRVIGRGGFGVVYHGYMDETQVAVKMLSPSSIQGYKEFQAEAKFLMNVNHKNLTRLIGYCHEGMNMGIIYEFMVNGNLRQHLSEERAHVLGWQERLQITIDAAQGLEYLHHGCKPSIIHRDVKSTNILLNEKFEAKLADFGLSRVVPIEGGTHVSTVVAGTPGYIDPEYYVSNRLTEKSDVYSFGVVLMEVITGRPAIGSGQENTYIVQWLSSMVQTADVKNIADPRLRGNFNVSSVWRAVELAMACINRIPARRPTMTYTVTELKACLEIEIAHQETESNDSIILPSPGLESVFHPRAR